MTTKLAILTSLALLLTLAVGLLYRRAGQLDAAFAPLGLTGRSYLLNGRQYHGLVQGRQVDASFSRKLVDHETRL